MPIEFLPFYRKHLSPHGFVRFLKSHGLLLLLLSHLSRVQLCATPWTAAYQAPPSMGFSRQEYWSGVPLPSPITWTSSIQKFTYIYTTIFVSTNAS